MADDPKSSDAGQSDSSSGPSAMFGLLGPTPQFAPQAEEVAVKVLSKVVPAAAPAAEATTESILARLALGVRAAVSAPAVILTVLLYSSPAGETPEQLAELERHKLEWNKEAERKLEAELRAKKEAQTPPTATAPCPALAEEEQQEKDTVKLKCDPDWTDCQKRQAREKIRRLNEQAKKKGGLKFRTTKGRIRNTGNIWAAKFRDDFNRLCKGQSPSRLKFTAEGVKGPTGTKDDFMDDCLYQEWLRSGQCDSELGPLSEASPDHVQDLQLGGHVQGQLIWLDREVNESLGRQMHSGANEAVDVANKFELACP